MATENTFKVVDSRSIKLAPIEDTTKEREVTVEFCERTTVKTVEGKEPETTVKGWWRAHITFVFDGSETTVTGTSAKPKAAIEQAIKNIPGSTTLDDFEDVDFDTDFYKQKLDTPAAAPVKWDMNVGDGHTLADMRSEMEATLVGIEKNEDDALDGAISLGRALVAVHAALGDNMSATEAFVRGEGLGEEASNMPHLKRLGSGANAIKEAMRFGQAHPNLVGAMSYKTATSGKGLERLKAQVQGDFVKAAALAYMDQVRKGKFDPLPATVTVKDSSVRTFDAKTAAMFLKCVLYAKDAFNIDNALDLALVDLGDAADARAAAYTTEFEQAGGKRFNPYIDEEFKQIKKAFGYNLMAWSGSTLPGAHTIRTSVDAINALNVLESAKVPDEEAIDKARAALIGKRTNPLLAAGAAEVAKLLKEIEAEQKQRQVAEQVAEAEAEAEGDEQLQEMRKRFSDKSAIEKAAQIFSLFAKESDWKEVMKALNDMATAKVQAEKDAAEQTEAAE